MNTTEIDQAVTSWLEKHHIKAKDIRDYSAEGAASEPTILRLTVVTNGADEIAEAWTELTSDGSHTFEELYAHRRALTAVLAVGAASSGESWRSKQHHPTDDPIHDGYFIVGIELPTGTITYHYDLKYWDDFDSVPVLNWANKWDGATADDTVVRLLATAHPGHPRGE